MEPYSGKAALSISEFSKSHGIGRDRVYEEIRSGKLKAKKIGRRTIITADAARTYLDGLPDLTLGPAE